MGVYSIGTEALLAVSAEIAALARFRHLRRDPMFTEMFRASPPRLIRVDGSSSGSARRNEG